MTRTKMRKGIVLALAGLSGLARQYQKGIVEMVQIQSAISYLRLMQGVRETTIVLFQYMFCGILGLTGLLFSQVALFLWIRDGFSPAVGVLLMTGLLELGTVLGFLWWFLSAKRWMREALRRYPALKKRFSGGGNES